MGRRSRNQAPIVASWQGGSLGVGPVMDDVGVKVRCLRAQVTTLYLPHSVWVVSIVRDQRRTLSYLCIGKLPHYSRVCGSCSTVSVLLHNVAGAPVSTASPSEFVPV